MTDSRRQRRIWYAVGGVLVVAFLAYGTTSFKSNLTPYVTFDEATKTLEAIDAGEIYGTIAQNPYKFGYDSMALMRELFVEKKTASEAGVPSNKILYVDTQVLRKGEGLKYKAQCDAWKASIAN